MAPPLHRRLGLAVIAAFLAGAPLTTASAQSLSLGGAACLHAAIVPSNAGSGGWTPCSPGLISVALSGARVGGTTVGLELGLHLAGASRHGSAPAVTGGPAAPGDGGPSSAFQVGLSLSANETFGPLGNVVFELDGDLRSDALGQLTLGARGVLGPVAARLALGAYGADVAAFDPSALASDVRPSFSGASAGVRLGLTGRLSRTAVLEADPELYFSEGGTSGRLTSRLRLLRALGENELRLHLRAGATPGFASGYGAIGAGILFPRGRAPDLDFGVHLGFSPAGLSPGLTVSLAETLPGSVRAALVAAWEPYRLDVHPGRVDATFSLPLDGGAIDLQVAGAFLDAVRPAAAAVTVRYTLPVKLP